MNYEKWKREVIKDLDHDPYEGMLLHMYKSKFPMSMVVLELKRKNIYGKLIERINDINANDLGVCGGGTFDCGDLGTIEIYHGRHGWQGRWLDRLINARDFIKGE